MSDPRYTDPMRERPLANAENERARQLGEMESTNAMWGWIAGGVVVVLLLLFIFGRSADTPNTASNQPSTPAATTGSAPPASTPPASRTQAPQQTPPATTDQGTSK